MRILWVVGAMFVTFKATTVALLWLPVIWQFRPYDAVHVGLALGALVSMCWACVFEGRR